MATAQKAVQPRQHAPRVNTFDIPELMPGARPSANPAQREEFEERCRLLHRESEAEREAEREQSQQAAGRIATAASPSVSDIEAMFPALDGALVRAIYMEAREPQDAIDTLLALSESAAEPVDAQGNPAEAFPPLEIGVGDFEKFPSLVDADGWEVATQKQFERDPDEDLGSAWRDRAKAAQHLPAPRIASAATPPARRRPQAGARKDQGAAEEPIQFETDYEFRHRVGQRRSKNKTLYGGRGSRRKIGNPRHPNSDDEAESTDSEEVVVQGSVLVTPGGEHT